MQMDGMFSMRCRINCVYLLHHIQSAIEIDASYFEVKITILSGAISFVRRIHSLLVAPLIRFSFMFKLCSYTHRNSNGNSTVQLAFWLARCSTFPHNFNDPSHNMHHFIYFQFCVYVDFSCAPSLSLFRG